MKFFGCLIQGGNGKCVHGRQHPPQSFWTLRHHDDGINQATRGADGGADTDIGLQEAIADADAGKLTEFDPTA